jgi:hypothetical protein
MAPCEDKLMNASLDDRITLSILESGQMLAWASHAAALVAGIGTAAAHSTVPRLVFGGTLLCWLVECWFAVRVAIDAALFRHLASEGDDRWRRLDELMDKWGLRRTNESRSTAERTRAAIGLWRRQAAALTVQLVMLIAAVLLQAVGL